MIAWLKKLFKKKEPTFAQMHHEAMQAMFHDITEYDNERSRNSRASK